MHRKPILLIASLAASIVSAAMTPRSGATPSSMPLEAQTATPATCTPATYDAVSNFSTASNPNGPWAYGWEPALGGTFTLNAMETTVYQGLDTWGGPDACGFEFSYPFVSFNNTGATLNYASGVSQPTNMLNLHPSCSGEFSVVRWTAPTTGWFTVIGWFQGIDTRETTTDVHILLNSTTALLDGNIDGFGSRVPINFARYLAANETLDFAVGIGSNGTFNEDSTGLAVTITHGAKLFAVSAQGENSTNELFRYEVDSTGTPTLDLTIADSSFDRPFGITFSSSGEMFIVNRGSGGGGGGSVSRFLNAGVSPSFNGTIFSSGFDTPHGATFRANELFIAQRFGQGVLRFSFDGVGNASLNGSIVSGLVPGFPRGVTVNPTTGELFVTECCQINEVNRYVFDTFGNAVANGVITGGGLSNPHDMAFSPWGELFVANVDGGVSRFVFDSAGNAASNGQLSGNGLCGPIGLAFSPWGELFVSNHYCPRISSWVFDETFAAIPNGSFSTPATLGELEFLPSKTGTVTIPSTAGPWSQDLNPAFNFGVGDNAPPIVIDGSSGAVFTPGGTITVTYLSGTVQAGAGCPFNEANGLQSIVTNFYTGVNSNFPAFYMNPGPDVYLTELVGTFANNGVIVGDPFPIGNGPKALTIPPGANQLLLGINDNLYSDNRGFFTVVVVCSGPPNQPPTADAGGPYSVSEGGLVSVTASGSDPDSGPLSFAWDLDNDGEFETSGQSVSFSAAGLDGPSSWPIKVRATDDCGLLAIAQAVVNIQNVAPVVGAITAPIDPTPVNTSVAASASFTDPGKADTHTAIWNWDDPANPTSPGAVTETNGSGSVAGNHFFTVAGVYEVSLTVTDDDSGTGRSIFQYVVVYDPNGGFVSGGGWIDSPAGAYGPEPTLSGRANFGFVSKYARGSNVPTGKTEFQFKAGDFNFQSTALEWLVVAGAKAQYKGSGNVNGAGDYGFILTAWDGQISGGGGVDKFRIKIWNKGTGVVVYDNKRGASDDIDSADTQELGGGSIVIHKDN